MLAIWIPLFLCFLTVFLAATLAWWRLANSGRQRKIARLVATVDPDRVAVSTSVLVAPQQPPAGLLARLLGKRNSNSPDSEGGEGHRIILPTLGMALAGALIGYRLAGMFGPAALMLGAAVCGALPALYNSRKRRGRLAAFEEQFPDALDFLARSVRAGNAFSIGLELLTGEAHEPLRSEFLKVSREQALGASLDGALAGIARRVAIVEVRFFVSAVLLQRETGGNLAEILAKLATAVRERLQLRGHVKAASAQGRLTARILTALPLLVLIMLKVMSPGYLRALTDDPTGRSLLAAAAVAQLVAYISMKKITDIRI